jgi:hypothetical protein
MVGRRWVMTASSTAVSMASASSMSDTRMSAMYDRILMLLLSLTLSKNRLRGRHVTHNVMSDNPSR